MYNNYVNGYNCQTKTMSSALNVLVNWKGGKRPPTQNYEYIKVIALTNKGNTERFRGDYYNSGKYGHMVWDCPKTSKEEGRNPVQAGEDAQSHINLSQEYTYIYVERFELLFIGVEETINEPKTIDSNITGINRRILGGTKKHSLLNKGNDTQGSGKAVSPWFMLLYSQSTVNVTSKVNPRHTWVVSPFPMQCRDKYHQDRGNPPRVRNRLVWRQVNRKHTLSVESRK